MYLLWKRKLKFFLIKLEKRLWSQRKIFLFLVRIVLHRVLVGVITDGIMIMVVQAGNLYDLFQELTHGKLIVRRRRRSTHYSSSLV